MVDDRVQSKKALPDELQRPAKFFLKFTSVLGSPIPVDLDRAFDEIVKTLDSNFFEPHRQRLLPKLDKKQDWFARMRGASTDDCR